MKSKKSMSAGFLVSMIIVLLAFVLIAGTVMRFLQPLDEKEAEALCHQSVALRTTIAIGDNDGGIKIAPLLCKTIDKKIKPEGKTKKQREEFIMKQVAEKMATCWWMFGEGNYPGDIFANVPAMVTRESHCFMCSTLVIENDEKFSDIKISGQEFRNYLIKTKYNKKLSYMDYFQFGGGAGYVNSVLTEEGIKPGRAYATVFNSKLEEKCSKCTWIAGVVGGAKLGGIKGAIVGGITAVAVTEIGSLFEEGYEIDGVLLLDMSHPTMSRVFNNKCVSVADMGGT
jgi:hypothetical protein